MFSWREDGGQNVQAECWLNIVALESTGGQSPGSWEGLGQPIKLKVI